MEIMEILNTLECAKNVLDDLTKELAEITKEKSIAEKEYSIEKEKQIERARAEKIQAVLINDVVKARMAEKYFKVRILEVKETYILNRLRNERSNIEILRTILSYKKEEMKDL